MSTKTEKLGLIKPELSDPANITLTNENWDKIDKCLGVENISEDFIAEQNSNLSYFNVVAYKQGNVIHAGAVLQGTFKDLVGTDLFTINSKYYPYFRVSPSVSDVITPNGATIENSCVSISASVKGKVSLNGCFNDAVNMLTLTFTYICK